MSARARVSASVAPLLIASFAAIAWHDSSAQSRWSVRDLGTLGGTSSAAEGISDGGVVIGNSDVASRSTHAFVWQNGTMRDLGTLGGPSSSVAGAEGDCYAVGASSVDGRGEVVGWSALEGVHDAAEHAFVWKAGKLRDLGTLGGRNSCAVAINASGVVIGKSQTSSSRAAAWPYGDKQPFVWERGSMHRLSLGGTDGWATSIGDSGVVVGWSQLRARDREGHTIYHAFAWNGTRLFDLGSMDVQVVNDHGQVFGTSGRSWSLWRAGRVTATGKLPASVRSFTPTAMNNRGQVVGYCVTPRSAAGHPCLWESGVLRSLGSVRGSDIGRALDINDRGQVVGRMKSTGGGDPSRAFVWSEGTMHDLGTIGGRASSAVAINRGGSIAGWSTTRLGRKHAVSWTQRTG